MNDLLPEHSLISVTFTLELPATAAKSDILEWVCHGLSFGGLRMDNPLSEHEVEALDEPVLKDMRATVRTTRFTDGKGNLFINKEISGEGK